jgi:hypothetical protein
VGSAAAEARFALCVEGLDAFAEIIRAAQAAIGLAFELDGERQARVLGVVEEFLRGALGERRKAAQFLDERVGRGFELAVGDGFARNTPFIGLAPPTRRDRMTMSLVRAMPTIFCRRAAPPEPGIWPSRCSGSA